LRDKERTGEGRRTGGQERIGEDRRTGEDRSTRGQMVVMPRRQGVQRPKEDKNKELFCKLVAHVEGVEPSYGTSLGACL